MKKVLLIWAVILLAASLSIGCGSKKAKLASSDSGDKSGITEENVGTTMDESGMAGEGSLSLSNLERVYFDFDNANLTDQARESLKKNYGVLKSYSGNVTIEGHCDERGSEEYNLALGERRAESIKRYLNNLGLSNSKMNIISFGEEKPLVIGSNESAWEKNRRGEILTK